MNASIINCNRNLGLLYPKLPFMKNEKNAFKGTEYTLLQGRQFLKLLVCFPAHQSPSEKGSTLKGKHLFPRSNFFL